MQRTRIYECMCLLDNREVRKGWQPLKDAVAGLFTKRGAEVVSARRWDERRLAYPIKGQQRGTYLLAYLKADTQQLAGIRRDLQFNESVLRSLVLGCEEVPPSAYEPEAEFDVSSIPVDDSPPVRAAAPDRAEAEAPPAAAGDGEARGAEPGGTTGEEAGPR
jgi:small subunit ribosomal protein S6